MKKNTIILIVLLLCSCTKEQDTAPIQLPPLIGSYKGTYLIQSEELGIRIEGMTSINISQLNDGQLLVRTMNGLATAIPASDTSYDYADFTKSYNYCHTTLNILFAGHSVLKEDSLLEGGSCIVFRNGRCAYGVWRSLSVKTVKF